MFSGCFKDILKVGCFKKISRNFLDNFHGCFICSLVSQVCFKYFSRVFVFQWDLSGCFKNTERVFQESFQHVSCVFHLYFKAFEEPKIAKDSQR